MHARQGRIDETTVSCFSSRWSGRFSTRSHAKMQFGKAGMSSIFDHKWYSELVPRPTTSTTPHILGKNALSVFVALWMRLRIHLRQGDFVRSFVSPSVNPFFGLETSYVKQKKNRHLTFCLFGFFFRRSAATPSRSPSGVDRKGKASRVKMPQPAYFPATIHAMDFPFKFVLTSHKFPPFYFYLVFHKIKEIKTIGDRDRKKKGDLSSSSTDLSLVFCFPPNHQA